MNTVDKLKWISEHSKPNNEILVRTNTSKRSFEHEHEWFVHYTYEFEDDSKNIGVNGIINSTVYRKYTDDLDSALDDIIEIIKLGNKEKYDADRVF